MKKILLGIIAINFALISLDTNAFEFKGIKSGMTVEEVNTLGLPLSADKNDTYWMDAYSLRQWIPNSELKRIDFTFDRNGKLYRLKIAFVPSVMDITALAGETLAVKEICRNRNVEYFEKMDRDFRFGCIFQDEELYQDDVDHYYQIKLENLK